MPEYLGPECDITRVTFFLLLGQESGVRTQPWLGWLLGFFHCYREGPPSGPSRFMHCVQWVAPYLLWVLNNNTQTSFLTYTPASPLTNQIMYIRRVTTYLSAYSRMRPIGLRNPIRHVICILLKSIVKNSINLYNSTAALELHTLLGAIKVFGHKTQKYI